MRKVYLMALGGTISMEDHHQQGLQSTLGAEELWSKIQGADSEIQLKCKTIDKIPSASIGFNHLLTVIEEAEKALEEGFCGFVVSQGTDTLEETAFFLNLFWKYDAPIVVMGAMRGAGDLSADGPMNLLSSIRVASSPKSLGRGVLVCMNQQIHASKWVRKQHSTSLETFESPVVGPLGYIHEGEVIYRSDSQSMGPLAQRAQEAYFSIPQKREEKVFLCFHTLEDDPMVMHWVMDRGYAGLVSAGVGTGHVSFDMRHTLIEVAQTIPVIMSSRTWSGSTTEHTYGYLGSEIDLKSHGIIMSGFLNPLKARLLLLACLWNQKTREEIQTIFKRWGNLSES